MKCHHRTILDLDGTVPTLSPINLSSSQKLSLTKPIRNLQIYGGVSCAFLSPVLADPGQAELLDTGPDSRLVANKQTNKQRGIGNGYGYGCGNGNRNGSGNRDRNREVKHFLPLLTSEEDTVRPLFKQ